MREINILQSGPRRDGAWRCRSRQKTIPASLANEKGPCVAQDPSL